MLWSLGCSAKPEGWDQGRSWEFWHLVFPSASRETLQLLLSHLCNQWHSHTTLPELVNSQYRVKNPLTQNQHLIQHLKSCQPESVWKCCWKHHGASTFYHSVAFFFFLFWYIHKMTIKRKGYFHLESEKIQCKFNCIKKVIENEILRRKRRQQPWLN